MRTHLWWPRDGRLSPTAWVPSPLQWRVHYAERSRSSTAILYHSPPTVTNAALIYSFLWQHFEKRAIFQCRVRTEDDGRWRVQQTSNALDMIVKSSIHVIRRCINTVPFLCDICYNVIMKLDRLELHINLHCDEDSLTQCRIECHRCWSVFCCTYGYTRVYVILCDILLFAVGVSMLWM